MYANNVIGLLSEDQFNVGFDKLVEMFPEESDSLQRNKNILFGRLVNGQTPTNVDDASLFTVPPTTIGISAISSEAFAVSETPTTSVTPCVSAVASTAVNTILVIIGLAGFHVPAGVATDGLVTALIGKLGVAGVTGLERTTAALTSAATTSEKVKAIATFAGEI